MAQKLKEITWPKVALVIVMLVTLVLVSQGIIKEEQVIGIEDLIWTISEQAVLDYLEPRIDPSIYVTAREHNMVVIDVEDYAVLLNGSSNKILGWKQNDDGSVLNWALDDGNLTTGRTWLERVAFIGNFTVTETLNPGSYTEIIIYGVLKAQANLNDAIFEKTTAGQHIYIKEGEIDGNLANQATPDVGRGIELQNVDDIGIEGVWIHDTKGEAVRLRDGARAQLDYTASNCEGSLLTLYGFDHAKGGVTGHTTTDDPIYQIIEGSDFNILDLDGMNGTEDGVTLDGSLGSETEGNVITAVINDVEDNGLELLSYSYSNHIKIVVNDTADYGLYIEDEGENNIVHDSSFNGWDSVQDGVYVAGDGNRLIDIQVTNYTASGKFGVNEVAGADDNEYLFLDLEGNDGYVSLSGTGHIIYPFDYVDSSKVWVTTKPGSFIIDSDGTNYWATNGYNGTLAYSGTDGDALINSIFGVCSGNEKIIIVNNVTIDTNLNGASLDSITFEGLGLRTWIIANDSLNANMLAIGNYWTIRSLSFDGNEDGQSSGHGIYGTEKDGNIVENCYFFEIYDTAIMIEGVSGSPSEYWKVTKNHFQDSGYDNALNNVHRNIYAYYSNHILISENTAYNGSHLFVQTNNAIDVVVTGNIAEAFFDAGSNRASFIEFYESWSCVATDNTLRDGNGEGVGVWGGGGHIIAKNDISEIGTTNTVSQQAIILNNGATDCIVEANVVNGTYGTAAGGTSDGHGIYIYGSPDNIVKLNLLVGIGSSPIAISGSGADDNDVYGNKIFDGYNRFGIEIAATGTPTGNRIGINYIAFSGYGRFNDAGADTRFSSIKLPITSTNGAREW